MESERGSHQMIRTAREPQLNQVTPLGNHTGSEDVGRVGGALGYRPGIGMGSWNRWVGWENGIQEHGHKG